MVACWRKWSLKSNILRLKRVKMCFPVRMINNGSSDDHLCLRGAPGSGSSSNPCSALMESADLSQMEIKWESAQVHQSQIAF